MSAIDQTHTTTKETIQLKSGRLVEEVKRLIHEGNVHRIVVRQDDRTIAEFPLAVGVVGVLLAAPLAALGALGALLNDCTIEVERTEPTPADHVVNAPVETPTSVTQAPEQSETPHSADVPK